MINALEYAYKKIRKIQKKSTVSPRFPMIILKTMKGWTGTKYLHREKIEGNCLSHQVVGKQAKTDKLELKILEKI